MRNWARMVILIMMMGMLTIMIDVFDIVMMRAVLVVMMKVMVIVKIKDKDGERKFDCGEDVDGCDSNIDDIVDVGDVNNSDSGCRGGGDGEVDGGSNDEGNDIVIMMMVRAKLVVVLI